MNEIWMYISGPSVADTFVFVIPVTEFHLDGFEIPRNNSSFFLSNRLHFDLKLRVSDQ